MHKLNLIPKELLQEINKKKTRFIYFGIAILLMFITAGTYKHIERQVSSIDTYLSAIENEIDRYRLINDGKTRFDEVREDNEVRRRIYEQVLDKGLYWTDLVNQIFDKRPEGVEILSLKLNNTGGIIVEGLSPKNFYISQMMAALEETGKIFDVSLGFSRHEEGGAKNIYAFQITARLKGD